MTDQLQVGDTLAPVTLAPVDRTMLALFAGASGDHNPIHVDVDFARRAGFDDVFAHGMLSMAWLGRALESWVEPERIRAYGVRFVHLTHIGDVPTCRATVRAVDDGPDGRTAELDLEVVLADGTVTLAGHATVDNPVSRSGGETA